MKKKICEFLVKSEFPFKKELGGEKRIFGGHPFELFKTPGVILTWIVARKVGRCDVGDGFGVDANNLSDLYQILMLP